MYLSEITLRGAQVITLTHSGARRKLIWPSLFKVTSPFTIFVLGETLKVLRIENLERTWVML